MNNIGMKKTLLPIVAQNIAASPDNKYYHRSCVRADTSRAALWIIRPYRVDWMNTWKLIVAPSRYLEDVVKADIATQTYQARAVDKQEVAVTDAKQERKRYNSQSKHNTVVKSKTTN